MTSPKRTQVLPSYGRDYLQGLKDGLGDKAPKMIVAEVTYEASDPTIDSQILQLQSAGVDVFVNITTPKFAAQAIRKVYDTGWKPVQYLNNISTSVASVLMVAGLDRSIGLISSGYLKEPTNPQWDGDIGMNDWRAFMKKYYPDGNPIEGLNTFGYAVARTLVQVLKQCGDNLTRENVMRQAANLRNFDTGVALPGIRVNTSASDYAPYKSLQLRRFDGKSWVLFGDVFSK